MAAEKKILPEWTDPDLTPDQFLYGRKGPWPQPSPDHPLKEAAEVLNVPLVEGIVWDLAVGVRLLSDEAGYPPLAAQNALHDVDQPIPTDAQFNGYMWDTLYTRYMRPASPTDIVGCDTLPGTVKWWKYDFSAMKLVKPIEGLYCAPVICIFAEDANKKRTCAGIIFRSEKPGDNVTVCPSGPPGMWNLAKIYALQGAAYHVLFVVHPALHMPLDAVNAITKTVIPQNHPLLQLLYPHLAYQLALDNAVLQGSNSVVNNSPKGTWFDPLMGDAYNLKLLFAAGYTGLTGNFFGDAYPQYDYMRPQLGFDSSYGQFLADYFKPFRTFCTAVADEILTESPKDTYVARWARHCSSHVLGFPGENDIFKKGILAEVLAIFMWDTTVSHGADHYSFSQNIPARYKFLRIRNYPPPRPDRLPADGPTKVGDVATVDDLFRMEMAHRLFFQPWAVNSTFFSPNLAGTQYAFTSQKLQDAAKQFMADLNGVADAQNDNKSPKYPSPPFMPLNGPSPNWSYPDYAKTIPASIQY